jgi:LexA-binding, inner membrane-associated putative hydrolase
MNTPSHFFMTAALAKALPRLSIVRWAVWVGAIAPDVPLWLLSIGGMLYYRTLRGWSSEATFSRMFEELFFNDPLWVIPHNFLHAPLVLLVGLAIAGRGLQKGSHWAHGLFWFLIACLLHTGVDILTHADDGPLIFFPFDWQTRFHSPVSYWDKRYHADTFQWFELGLNIVCVAYLIQPRLLRWFRRRSSGS